MQTIEVLQNYILFSAGASPRPTYRLPEKRELADPVTNRAVVQSNEYRQTPSPELSAGTARPINGNLTFP